MKMQKVAEEICSKYNVILKDIRDCNKKQRISTVREEIILRLRELKYSTGMIAHFLHRSRQSITQTICKHKRLEEVKLKENLIKVNTNNGVALIIGGDCRDEQ